MVPLKDAMISAGRGPNIFSLRVSCYDPWSRPCYRIDRAIYYRCTFVESDPLLPS